MHQLCGTQWNAIEAAWPLVMMRKSLLEVHMGVATMNLIFVSVDMHISGCRATPLLLFTFFPFWFQFEAELQTCCSKPKWATFEPSRGPPGL